MATVFSQMGRNAIRPGRQSHLGGANRIRIALAARVSDCRDVIDVYAQAEPVHARSLLLPGSSAGSAARSGGSASAAEDGISRVAKATKGKPTSARPPDRSTMQAQQ